MPSELRQAIESFVKYYRKVFQTIDIIPIYVYNKPMYSVKEAAQKLGLDTSQVRRLLAKGEIKGVKLARDWVVLELNYQRKRKPKGGDSEKFPNRKS